MVGLADNEVEMARGDMGKRIEHLRKLFRAWQKPAWEISPWREHGAVYRTGVVGYALVTLGVTIACFRSSTMPAETWSLPIIGVVAALASIAAVGASRAGEHVAWGPEAVVVMAVAVSGHPVAAVVAVVAVEVAAAIRKPIVLHMASLNVLHMASQVALVTWTIATLSGDADPGAGLWLLSAVVAVCAGPLVLDAVLARLLVVGGYIERTEYVSQVREICTTHVAAVLPQSLMLGLVLAVSEQWALLLLLAPLATVAAISQTSDQLVDAHRVARRDALTGLLNRVTLASRLEHAIEQSPSDGKVGNWIVICDLDNFKLLNDTHGHDVGDDVLVTAARAIAASVRESDEVFRYGGEEFLVILGGATQESAVDVAERIRSTVESVFRDSYTVTASVGLHGIVASDDPLKVLTSADKAMYCSKQSGKNRVSYSWMLEPALLESPGVEGMALDHTA